ncbi:SRPBCC domain-containing protein [Tistrella mobilis]|uniref:Activator of HSP90 ATPase 1 family protein n=1 Tax=Tistrella mobilis (strain KA081020-065) TaxID=1110502 RepID=I3TUX8_TISMK|nr:SRPBCC domain-containing protein [Tistrella mobilis]AFK56566.1 activator of HSP90 ATPase 1 family protein [Tistrella mobilis KA081020-065]
MTGSKILVALRIAAPTPRVFRAFTDEIGLWWQADGLFAFTPGPPGRLSFDPKGPEGRLIEEKPDGARFEIGRILTWEAPPAPGTAGRLALTWRQASFAADQETRVFVAFDPVEDGTRVTVEHLGWDAIPISHAARHHFPDGIFLHRHGSFWRRQLAGLAAVSVRR